MKRREYITPLITLVIAMALVLGGCTKTEEADMPLTQIEQLTPKTLEEQILDMLSILDDLGDEHVMEIVFSEDHEGEEPTAVFYFLPKPDGFGASGAIVCKDTNAVRFARCVYAWHQENKGKCLKTYVEDGTWFADDDCQR